MSTAYPFEPLRAVPALDRQRTRFAVLLHLKDTLLRGRDAASGAVTTARSLVAGLVGRLHLHVPLAWLGWVASRLGACCSWDAGALGRSGTAALAVTLLASPPVRRALLPLSTAGRTLGERLVGAAVTGTDRALRCLGRPGTSAAGRLQTTLADAHRWITQVARPVLRRAIRLADPATPQMQVLGGVARSYLLHRACTLAVHRRVLRLLVQAVLIPAAANSSLVSRLHRAPTGPQADGRAEPHRSPTPPATAPCKGQDQQGGQGLDLAKDNTDPGGASPAVPTQEEPAGPELLNRAQRRARQQQQARARRRTS